jgi:hypothetical protein
VRCQCKAKDTISIEIFASWSDIPGLLVGMTILLSRLADFHRGEGDDEMSTHAESAPALRRTAQWTLFTDQCLPLGAHVVTPRRGYLHHGIYVGDGQVVHYAGFAYRLQRGPVEELSLTLFSRGRPVWFSPNGLANREAEEIVRRARSRVGEDCYRLLTNNCEHFCEWCLRGEPRSYQVEAWRVRPGRALHVTLLSLARPFSAPVAISRCLATQA